MIIRYGTSIQRTMGFFKKKDALREEDIKLTKEIHDLQRKYEAIYKAVDCLSQSYTSYKDYFPLYRYGKLKDMIKACMTDEVAAKHDSANTLKRTGVTVSLLQAAKQFSSRTAGISAAIKEVYKLPNAEIVKDIEDKKKKRDKLSENLDRLPSRLKKLKRDYEESKNSYPTTRYRLMKEMIKTLIRDEDLKCD